MALVTRQFPPSRSKKPKRMKHIMLAGGREGPEVAAKKPKTARYVEQGSDAWTADLAAEKTPEDARTQPPFLRSVVRDYRAYARGLMTVKESIDLLVKTRAYADLNPGYTPLIEFTGVTADGRLASFTGRLLEPVVGTMAQETSPNWAMTLRKLAEELRLIEAAVPRISKAVPAPAFAYVPRVYLNMTTSSGREVSVPVEQMSVVVVGEGVGLAKAEVVGVYAPGPEDGELRLKGQVMKVGEPVRLPVDAIEFVNVDPPKFGEDQFMETPAFARSRGFLIELTAEEMARTKSTEARFIVPFDQVLRVRMIYPPAEGYSRRSSSVIESVDSVAREIDAATNHLRILREELAYKTLARLSSKTGRNVVTITDEVSGFRFGLESPTFEGATRPVMVWMPFIEKGEEGRLNFIPPQGEYNLMGRKVTPIDYLRLLRAARPDRGLRELRRFRARR